MSAWRKAYIITIVVLVCIQLVALAYLIHEYRECVRGVIADNMWMESRYTFVLPRCEQDEKASATISFQPTPDRKEGDPALEAYMDMTCEEDNGITANGITTWTARPAFTTPSWPPAAPTPDGRPPAR